MLTGLALLSLAIWLYLFFAHGNYWRVSAENHNAPIEAPARAIAAVVPARNEAAVIAISIRSLIAQNYSGRFQIFVVDDESTDDTAKVARQTAAEAGRPDRLTVIRASTLPPGWTGKLWALSQGIEAAASFAPDYFLFTDADIVHPANQLAHLVARAEAGRLDLVSIMAQLSCESAAEKFLIPSFVYFFFMLYPPVRVAAKNRATAAAAGGCILIRTQALKRIGGVSAIRGEIIDDCALARAVKPGAAIWLGLEPNTRSIRSYTAYTEVEQMISRTAFTELKHSVLLLAATVLAMTVIYLVPPLLLLALKTNPLPAALGAAAWLLMSVSFAPILRYYHRSIAWAPLLPFVAAFYVGATIHSAVLYWQNRGGRWKGRIQAPTGPR